ncbi:MAG: hypothetical protein U9R40_07390 [Synergistota bacterium]|nr:hypothetical protein [Synergistota bacterium]
MWTPGEMSFPDNVVRIDKKGFLWNTYLEADLPIKPGRGGCGGRL